MPKVTLKIVDVNVVLEMNLTEATALRDALGDQSESEAPGNYDTYLALRSALKNVPEIPTAGGAE